MAVESLAQDAGIALHWHGSASLVRAKDVDAFLDAAGRHGVTVLGIEGFHAHGTQIVPDLDAILDLSSLNDPARSIVEAKAFVDKMSARDLLFEFVLGDDA
jgi:hypothetical protein